MTDDLDERKERLEAVLDAVLPEALVEDELLLDTYSAFSSLKLILDLGCMTVSLWVSDSMVVSLYILFTN